jgi:hypothetical protein
MNRERPVRWHLLAAVVLALAASRVCAHSASDAYLTLDVDTASEPGPVARTVVHAQWDIALRDLDFVLKLDDDGDGNITWAELRKHQTGITAYAMEYLNASSDRGACTISPKRQMVDNHADGAYAALFFDIACVGAAKRITLDYRLFFAMDPSHRGILAFHSGPNTATALLSPDNARIELRL